MEGFLPTQYLQRTLSLGFCLVACSMAIADEPMEDVAKVVGVESCRKCHKSEVMTWEKTPHALTIEQLHRKPEAKAIAKRLGIRSVKRNDVCVKCHYTQRDIGGRLRIDSGVSCESCHGPAKDWLEVHADYGPGVTRLTESPEHRATRRQQSISLGMNNPTNLYLIAKQCLDCHTTPDERLVDVGGHPAGSLEFNLVAWSQGTVRHNFVRSDGAVNAVSSVERLRLMHIVGIMADLEFSLRATAKAQASGKFAQTSAQRAATKKQALWEIQRLVNNPLITPALEAVSEVELTLGNKEAIQAAAESVGNAAMKFAEEADGSTLSAIDPLLPSPDQYK